eukprot:Gb_08521 [translate_table: standard]
MKGETRLASAVFQLTPTRTRCELVISAEGMTEKLASGLLKPFLTHLKTAEEQIAKGGYSIRLEPPGGTNQDVSWFTKGTMERFVRFVSTPEVLERVNTVESEIIQIEEAISVQCTEALAAEDHFSKSSAADRKEVSRPIADTNPESAIVPYKSRRHSVDGNEAAQGENSKARLLKVLETRKMVLQKEQGMAFARAAAAGFDMEHMVDLVAFAECFGALRLREACLKFMDLWKKKQEAGLWLEEMELETMEASSSRSEVSFMNASGIMLTGDSVLSRHLKAKDFPDTWSDVPSEIGDSKVSSSHDGMSSHGKFSGTECMPVENGEYASSNHNREGQGPAGLVGSNEYIRGHFQQPMMPAWPGQVPQYMQSFQSNAGAPGHTMQGLHGIPMQSMPYYPSYPVNPSFFQAPYPQAEDHPGLAVPPPHSLSHWPRYAEEPRFVTAQRSESHTMSHISADLKHYGMDERDSNLKSETSEAGSPKSISRSQELTDQGTQSELEKEVISGQELRRHMRRRSASPHRRSSSPRRRVQIGRSGNKRSGMVVIRNINYITSNRHDRAAKEEVSEESNSEIDSDVEDDLKQKADDVQLRVQDVIGLFEKKQKDSGESSKKKGARRHSVDSWNSGEKGEKSTINDPSTEAGRNEDDSESWKVFQKFLLRDEESSQTNPDNGYHDEVHATEQGGKKKAANEEEMIAVTGSNLVSKDWPANKVVSLEQELGFQMKEQGIGEDSLVLPERDDKSEDASLQRTLKFEALNGKPLPVYKKTISDEEFLLPQGTDSTRVRGDDLLENRWMAEREGSSIHKKSTTYDDFIVSRQAGQMNSTVVKPDPFAGDEVEHIINQHSDSLPSDKNCGQSLGDDSFMVSTRSILQDQANDEWRTPMNMDSELPSAEKAENSSNGVLKNRSEFLDSYEPDGLVMLPERNSERDSLGLSWDLAMDYDMQVNMTEKKDPDAELNGFVDESKPPKEKGDAKIKEQPVTKKSEKEVRLKSMQEALEKRKAEMAARNGKLSKSNPLAEAQVRAERLRAFKAGLQKTKKEMEEEEKKRLEELKIQRQKRIAARRSSSPASSTSTSRSAKQQQLKPGPSSKSSLSSQKARTSNSLSPGGSFPSPSVSSRSITKSSSEIASGSRSRKSNISNNASPIGNGLSRSVPSLSELKKENDGIFPQSRAVSHASKRLSTSKRSSDQGVSSKVGKDGGSSKSNDATSHATPSDNSDVKKRHLPATRKSIAAVSELKGKSVKGSLDLDNGLQKSAKNTSMQAIQRGKGSNLATGVGNEKSKGNTGVDVSKKHNDDVVPPAKEIPQLNEAESLTVLRPDVSVETNKLENGSISDNESGKKAGIGPGYIPIRAPASTNAGDVAAQDPVDTLSDSCHVKQSEAGPIRAPVKTDDEFETDEVSQSASAALSTFVIPDTSVQLDMQQDEGNVLQASSSMLRRCQNDEPYQAPFARMTSFDEPLSKFSNYSAPIAPEMSSAPHGIFIPRAPISENYISGGISSDSANASPLLQSMPKLPQSISPGADDGKLESSLSQQKWGSIEKPLVKESSKGFKRLLKFGRKSHSSSAYEGNGDAELREGGGRTSKDQDGKHDVNKDAGNVNHLSGITSVATSDNGRANQAHSLGSLISQEDNTFGGNSHKASRSFFSLSTFRSKGSEGKSR